MPERSRSLSDRMVRAAKLEAGLYNEVKADPAATRQALMATVIASVAAGIGSGIYAAVEEETAIWFLWSFLMVVALLLAGWLVWSYLTYFLGTKLFATVEMTVTFSEWFRTVGFSNSPGVIAILAFVPILGPILTYAVPIWVLVAEVIVVRQVMRFSTWRALGTWFVGWISCVVVVLFVVEIVALTGLI